MNKNNFEIYKYFKGEKENPFELEKQNTQYHFWGYEQMFETKFIDGDFSVQIWAPFQAPDLEEWRKILSKNPVDKEDLFNIWLHNLLMVRLPEKYQSEDDKFLRLYYDTEV